MVSCRCPAAFTAIFGVASVREQGESLHLLVLHAAQVHLRKLRPISCYVIMWVDVSTVVAVIVEGLMALPCCAYNISMSAILNEALWQ